MKTFFLSFILILIYGCSNDNAIVNHYNKNIKITCMRLVIFPPDNFLEKTLTPLYPFSKNCEFSLQVSKKGGIVCNSNQNADKKALSNFPTGFIRFDLYKKSKPIYSYYRDLTSPLSKQDIEKGFLRLREDLLH